MKYTKLVIIAIFIAIVIVFIVVMGKKSNKTFSTMVNSDGCPRCAIKDCEGPLKPFGICGCKCPEGSSFQTDILTLERACASRTDWCRGGWMTKCNSQCFGPVY